MSGQQVGGLVGAYLGSLIGQPQLGFVVGSAIGGTFDPTVDTKGPRLGDLRIQISGYGKPLPKIFGTIRIAGNVIWSSGLIETPHTRQTGKGGGGGTSQTDYSYAASFAISLCSTTTPTGANTPIVGIGKVWADGALIANYRAIDLATVQANAGNPVVVYTGTETQLPDPTMQAYLGIANVPAYRGQAYVVFNNMQLAKYGNRIPNIEIEVVESGVHALSFVTANTAESGAYSKTIAAASATTMASSQSFYGSGPVDVYSISNQASPRHITTITRVFDANTGTYTALNYIMSLSVRNDDIYIGQFAALTKTSQTGLMQWSNAGLSGVFGNAVNSFRGFCRRGNNNIYAYSTVTGDIIGVITTPLDNIYTINNGLYATEQYLYYANNYGHTLSIYDANTLALLNTVSTDTTVTYGPSTLTVNNGYVYMAHGPSVCVFSADTTLTFLSEVSSSYGGGGVQSMSVNGNFLMAVEWNIMSVFDISDPTNIRYALPVYYGLGSVSMAASCCSGGFIYSSAYSSSVLQPVTAYTVGRKVTPSQVTVANIVSSLCSHSGTNNIDVSQLTDSVDGYVIGSQMSARAAIEPLQRSFYFDSVETDNLIRFVKRGSQTITVIPEDELAAHAPQTKIIPAAVNLSHAQELELPELVNVSYYNYGNDYQQGSQYSKRQTVTSKQIVDIQLPLALSDTKAKQIADVNLFLAWVQKDSVTFSTTRKYAYLDPSDVIQVTRASGVAYTLLLTKRTEAAGGIINWEAVVDDASVYSQDSVPSSGVSVAQTALPSIVDTRLVLLDIPLLRDQDDLTGSGYYFAANGYTAGWSGGALFKSVDAGASYLSTGAISGYAAMGKAKSALGNYLGGNTFDELNSVVIAMDHMELASTTETLVLAGSNVAVIGNEIIQFKNAVLIGANTYTLTGLLRGRFGTEAHMTTHSIGDRFVLLSAGTIGRNPAELNDIGMSRIYKAPSSYQLLSAASPISFTDTGAGIKPLSPVQVAAGRDAAGNVTIKWVRRTRIGGGWNSSADVPLGETSESYSIDIMNGAVVARTLTSTTPAVSYTSAMQVTDFGSNQAAITVNVYQISATIGRGFGANAVV